MSFLIHDSAAFGNGIGVTTTLISLIANAAPRDQAVATACSYLFRSLGSVVGMSIAATVVQQSLRNQLSKRLENGKDAEQIVRRVRKSLDVIKTLEPRIAEIVRQCYGKSTGYGFMVMTGIVACALISSCKFLLETRRKISDLHWTVFIREKKLSK